MEWSRKKKLMLRWSIVSAGLIALFWLFWYWKTGSVPVIHSIRMTESWTMHLPFAMSRWWDILIGPIWTSGLFLILTSKRIRNDEDLAFELVFALGAGLVAALVFVLGAGLVAALVATLVATTGTALGVALAVAIGGAGRFIDLNEDLIAAGLVAALFVGLGAGLVAWLFVGLGAGLVFALVATIVFVFSRECCSAIGRWLTAR